MNVIQVVAYLYTGKKDPIVLLSTNIVTNIFIN